MGKKGDFAYAYNAQISVDAGHQIIVGLHVSLNANDKKEVKPALEQIKETTGTHPEKMSLDNGYMSGENLQCLSETEIDVYIAVGKGEVQAPEELDDTTGKIKAAQFTYNREEDIFVCPAGNRLPLKRKGEDGKKVYQAGKDDCDACRHQSRCCSWKGLAPRCIHTDDKEPLRQQMRDKMKEPSAKEVYKKRKVIVEPVFGHIKNGGFREFSVRGHDKVSGEFSLVTTAYNFKKIVRALLKGVVCLEHGRVVPATG